MINRFIDYLAKNKVLNATLVLGYILFVVFAHEWFVNVSVQIMNGLSLPVYERLVSIVAGLVLVGLLVAIYLLVRTSVEFDKQGLSFLLASLAGLVIHFFVFTEMNIEFIHAMEFGLLAAFIYPLVGRYGAAVVYAFPIMLFDEWYQYQVLFDYVEYFDFNDILLDLLGAGLFLSALKVFNQKQENSLALFKRPEFITLTLIVAVVVGLIVASKVVPYPADAESNTWLILNDIQEAYGFWREHPLIGSTYHVLEPIQGLITVFTVCMIYLGMDSIRFEK